MMFRKKNFAFAVELAPNQFFHPNSFPNPERNRHEKTFQTGRRVSEITVQDPIELQKRLLVERDVIKIADVDAAFAQAIIDRAFWKIGVVFFARESFLLRGGDDFSIANETSRAVVIKSRDAENIHRCA